MITSHFQGQWSWGMTTEPIRLFKRGHLNHQLFTITKCQMFVDLTRFDSEISCQSSYVCLSIKPLISYNNRFVNHSRWGPACVCVYLCMSSGPGLPFPPSSLPPPPTPLQPTSLLVMKWPKSNYNSNLTTSYFIYSPKWSCNKIYNTLDLEKPSIS